MKTAAKKMVGFSVGALVALTEEYISLFETFELRNVICEVVDVRKVSGSYAYQVAPVGNRERVVEVYASDIRKAEGCGVG